MTSDVLQGGSSIAAARGRDREAESFPSPRCLVSAAMPMCSPSNSCSPKTRRGGTDYAPWVDGSRADSAASKQDKPDSHWQQASTSSQSQPLAPPSRHTVHMPLAPPMPSLPARPLLSGYAVATGLAAPDLGATAFEELKPKGIHAPLHVPHLARAWTRPSTAGGSTSCSSRLSLSPRCLTSPVLATSTCASGSMPPTASPYRTAALAGEPQRRGRGGAIPVSATTARRPASARAELPNDLLLACRRITGAVSRHFASQEVSHSRGPPLITVEVLLGDALTPLPMQVPAGTVASTMTSSELGARLTLAARWFDGDTTLQELCRKLAKPATAKPLQPTDKPRSHPQPPPHHSQSQLMIGWAQQPSELRPTVRPGSHAHTGRSKQNMIVIYDVGALRLEPIQLMLPVASMNHVRSLSALRSAVHELYYAERGEMLEPTSISIEYEPQPLPYTFGSSSESECDEDNDEDGESDPGPRDRGKRSLASMLVPIGEDCGLLHRGRLHLAKSLRVTALQTSRNA